MPFACSVAVAKQRGCCGNFMAVLGRRGFVASVRLHEVRGFSKHHLTPRAWILLPPRVTKISYGDYGRRVESLNHTFDTLFTQIEPRSGAVHTEIGPVSSYQRPF